MPLKDRILTILLFVVVGLFGAIPLGILGLIFGDVSNARDMVILGALVLGSAMPLRLGIDQMVKGQAGFQLPSQFNGLFLSILSVALIVIIPFLYLLNFMALLVGIIAYVASSGSLLIAVLVALMYQIVTIYRNAQREKELGINNNIFMRMGDISAGGFDVSLNSERMQQQTPREESPQIVYLPEDNLRERPQTNYDDEPMTITIDPDAEQSDVEG